MRFTNEDIDAMTLGALVLGSGGAGDPYLAAQMLRSTLKDGEFIEILSLDELAKEVEVAPFALVGSPHALQEKLLSTADIETLFKGKSLRSKRPDAVMPYELAGPNALYPLAAAAHLGVPLLDADFLGRGFSSLDMTMIGIADAQPEQHMICDTRGRTVTLKTSGSLSLETLIRPMAASMGWLLILSTSSLNRKFLKSHSLPGTVTYCLQIGKVFQTLAELDFKDAKENLETLGGRLLDSGRIVERVPLPDPEGSRASIIIELDGEKSPMLRVEQRNEFHLVARDGEIIASVPDIIVLADRDTWLPISSEEVSVQRDVHVIALPAHPRWYETETMERVGPRNFGYQVDYVKFNDSVEVEV